jgi:hypothetical protein
LTFTPLYFCFISSDIPANSEQHSKKDKIMEAKIYKTAAAIFFTAIFSLSTAIAGNSIKNYFGNNNFQFEENAGEIHVEMNKNPWESFTLAIDNVEVMNNPVVKFQISANENVILRVDLTDGTFMSSEISVLEIQVQKTNDYQNITFDFSEMISDINLSESVFLVVYVNPGKKFDGEINIKNFELSATTQNGENNTDNTGFNVYPSPATSFTNVEIPATGYNTLKIYNLNGKEVLAADVAFYAGTTYYVELSNLPSGYYTIQLCGSEKTATEKLIVR